MTHLWVRAEQRDNETRVGLTPDGARQLIASGITLTVEQSPTRVIPDAAYAATGCTMAPAHSWPDAPKDAIIFGLKELPEDGTPLPHRHIMFGHAFKGQPAGRVLLQRFKAGGGTLLDLEYLVDDQNRRVAAFGYWAGYAGAAVALKCWAAQQRGSIAGPVTPHDSSTHLLADLQSDLLATGTHRPTALIIGALGRVGTGVFDLCTAMGVACTKWDMAETTGGGPFPEVLAHDLFFNCVLARPGTPVFVPAQTADAARRLSVIADIACDPDSDFSPIKVYDRTTTWAEPARRVHDQPMLDVTAIDNLPSLLPLESSQDYAAQLLPTLMSLKDNSAIWQRAATTYRTHRDRL
ncbi:saccharopine dehydrogenase [Roseobacter denitrificans]|uniref:Saccharopine dehydrogenase [NAD(+), L-lysine-forming] n=1 Tax=Roseobacter denitrificans (strain ATCC 33942 / OCh 114) TaxID=375451 RepID=Q16C99_ROSDO|nr:saccharopine dehydrogenase [Roseobacter denitrificans]ABG30394.1 saccharopine dehydrogenase, putative [Roseobacter denitrificans OCh 114]AVL53553.1 saccharopine dehydrogenase [Roseobacter denitrificans]SFF72257.1 saccharopine dehydrogenase (NAD+, L-lysine-forming) [Roseobacter denitrificans OCh 114]